MIHNSSDDHDLIIARRPNRAPTHPGTLVRDIVIPSSGLSITAVAARLNITRQQLHRVLSGDSGISPEMALRLGVLCGNGPTLWMRMQENYDLWHARQTIGPELATIQPLDGMNALPDARDIDDSIQSINRHMR